jgi:MSHA biogenesis protein MshI
MRWPWQSKSNRRHLHLGICQQDRRFAAVCLEDGQLSRCFPESEEDDDSADALWQWLIKHELQFGNVSLLLPDDAYQLHLLQAPDVDDAELANALRFGLGDLVSRPLEEVVVEAFRIPPDVYRGRSQVAMAVVSERAAIAALVEWANSRKLRLQQILVGELAILNLMAVLEPDCHVAVLNLGQQAGRISLYKDGALYLSRSLHIGWSTLQESLPGDEDKHSRSMGLQLVSDQRSAFEQLSLEVQRSLDYFDSQMGMGMVGQLWLLPETGQDNEQLTCALEQSMGTACRVMGFPGLRSDGRQLLALAAALQPLPQIRSEAGWI